MHRSAIMVLTAAGALQAAGALAQTGDFTFRRVAPPAPGAPRITVQIDPAEQARALGLAPGTGVPDQPAPAPGAQPPAASGADDWFWAALADTTGPARLARALALLEAPPAGAALPTPRLQDLQRIAAAHGTDILRHTVGTPVSPALVLAMIAVESSGDTQAVSGAGAQGLMQLIPATAVRFGVGDITDAGDNIKGGVAYMSWLMETFGNDPILALAGYNAGENAVRAAGGVPDYPETRAYVPRVLAAWKVARGLCLTPPELITDGCVFAVREARSDG